MGSNPAQVQMTKIAKPVREHGVIDACRGRPRCHAPPFWPYVKVLKPNFQSIVSQTNNACSLLLLISAKLLLLDISAKTFLHGLY